jgi:penicillin-binding protein-related factor A (putative recombinase)
MQKREAAITTKINKWFSLVVPTSSPWEVKHTRGKNSFPWRELKEHQRNYLFAATTQTGCTFKIEDAGYSHPPFDVLHYKNTDAFVIITFNVWTAVIEIRTVLRLIEKHTSISEEEALENSVYKILNKSLPK